MVILAYQGKGIKPLFTAPVASRPPLMKRDGDLIRAVDLEGIPAAAIRLGVSRQRVHQLIGEGKLDFYQLGKRRMVHRRDIDRLQSMGWEGRKETKRGKSGIGNVSHQRQSSTKRVVHEDAKRRDASGGNTSIAS